MWKNEADEGFRLLKQKIIEKPILALPYFKKLFEVKCDASGMAIDVVLSQEEKPISYSSENLNDAKKNILHMIKNFMQSYKH